MATEGQTAPKRVVAVAIDGSENAKEAFRCKTCFILNMNVLFFVYYNYSDHVMIKSKVCKVAFFHVKTVIIQYVKMIYLYRST